MNKVSIERLATGVPGLDEMLGGGIPSGRRNEITCADRIADPSLARPATAAG